MDLEIIILSEVRQMSYNVTYRDFPHGSDSKEFACNAGDTGSTPGQQDPLEKAMAAQSHNCAWRIPWTEEPGRLESIGSQKIGHD